MRLKTIIVDGFKSYGGRTVIGPFDETFNAITGFNGSGKSNILDAICFVMGISTSSMRARTLQELIFKGGTSGVTKAMVSLIFDNLDKRSSPPGYEECDEITVSRGLALLGAAGLRNKYLINGRPVLQKQVDSLFHSVSLNVNNPHFLIMQGRITKVLSMKPPEVLSLLEETAGTKHYDEQCALTRAVFDKKARKIDEINAVISDEIAPKLEQLKKEQALYERFKEREKQAEQIRRAVAAYKYMKASALLDSAHHQALKAEHDGLLLLRSTATAEVEQLELQLQRRADALAEFDGNVQQLEASFSAQENEAIDQEQELQHLRETCTQAQQSVASLEKSLADAQAQLASKGHSPASSASPSSSSSSLEKDGPAQLMTRLQKELALADRRFEAAQSGAGDVADTNELGGKSMGEELSEVQQAVSKAGTVLKKNQTRQAFINKQLAEKKKQVQGFDQKTIKLKQEYDGLQQQIVAIEQRLSQLPAQSEIDLEHGKAQLLQQLRQLQSRCDMLGASLTSLQFRYHPSCPVPAAKVHGRVAELMGIKDDRHATALEIAAGAKLHNVIVDDLEVGKTLIKSGQLARRTTFIPLNSVKDSVLPPAVVSRAEQIAQSQGGWCAPALSLVDVHPRHGSAQALSKAFKYVLGTSLVCDEKHAKGLARRITFDEKVRKKTITLEGDIYDPQGSVSGGFRQEASQDPLLKRVTQRREAVAEMARVQAELQAVDGQLAGLRRRMEERAAVEADLDLVRHRLSIVTAEIDRSPQQQLMNEIGKLEEELAELDRQTHEANATIAEGSGRIRELQEAIHQSKAKRDTILQEIKVQREEIQKRLKEAKEAVRDSNRMEQQRAMECQALVEEIAALEAQQDTTKEQVQKLSEEIEQRAEALGQLRHRLANLKEIIRAEKAKLSGSSREVKDLEQQRARCQKTLGEAGLKIQKAERQIEQFERENQSARQHLEQLLAEHPWIETEKRFFGVAGTEFDLGAFNLKERQSCLKNIEQEQTREGSKINRKVLAMFQSVTAEYDELVQKRDTLKGDRDRIEAFMVENNIKKKEVLMKTYTSVNQNFGLIFARLLPGSRAMLAPPEGQTFEQGLCFKVAFGLDAPWKESLTELSGGQRSLLALSLVLALLRSNPAPMYILDEIDAALDLSHTQNIGEVIRSPEFSSSQFIVVSLKEGMFNNANVLFRTKLINGSSTVKRTG